MLDNIDDIQFSANDKIKISKGHLDHFCGLEQVDDHGLYCFEFDHLIFKTALRKCLQSRGRDKTLCYQAHGILVYKQEVTHIIIIFCEDDNEYQSYPLIDATSTKHFKPSVKSKLPGQHRKP